MRELRRQALHFAGVAFIPLAWVVGTYYSALTALAFSLLFSLLSDRKHSKGKLHDFEVFLHKAFKHFERRDGKKLYEGVVYFFLGIGLSLLLLPHFSEKAAFLAVAVLSVYDSFSAIVGYYLGAHRVSFHKSKTWEGFLGGVLASSFFCLTLATPPVAVLVSLLGGFAEVAPFKLNDNVLIPLVVGLALLGLNLAGVAF